MQKIVSDSLDRLQATRIVIAHRLSTIVNADRIFVKPSQVSALNKHIPALFVATMHIPIIMRTYRQHISDTEGAAKALEPSLELSGQG